MIKEIYWGIIGVLIISLGVMYSVANGVRQERDKYKAQYEQATAVLTDLKRQGDVLQRAIARSQEENAKAHRIAVKEEYKLSQQEVNSQCEIAMKEWGVELAKLK